MMLPIMSCRTGSAGVVRDYQKQPLDCHFAEMSNGKTKIIIDCDPGADDAQAILMALNASHVEILAITTVFGNCTAENCTKNALRLVTYCNRSDIPVYKGCETCLLMESVENNCIYYGKDGFGSFTIPGVDPVDLSLISSEHASLALCRLVSQYPESVTLIALGPLTNIATCLKLDANFGHKLKDCIIMGGNYRGRGNMTPAAENNFWKDPEAAQAVLNGLKIKPTLITLETCLEHGVSWDWYEKEYASGETKLSALMRNIDRPAWKVTTTKHETEEYVLWDQLAMCVLLDPKAVEEVTDVCASVELHGNLTRGQVVIDWQKKLNTNIFLVKKINMETCKEMMIQSIKMF